MNTFAAIMGKTSFYTLEVSDIRRETSDTVSIAFKVPEGDKGNFNYTAGQYLTFKKDFNGQEIRRAYSLCSSPADDELRIAVKQVENGLFSKFANQELKVGDKIEVMPPMGNFKLEPKSGASYLAIAAGSGITPILSMIKTAMIDGANFTLLYGSKTEKDIIFKNILADLSQKYNFQLKVYHVLSRENESSHDSGRVDEAYIRKHLEANKYDSTFLCGPEEMINKASEILRHNGYQKDQIHFELFTAPIEVEKDELQKSTSEKFTAQVTLIIDDEEETISVDSQGDSILEHGLLADLDLPFACKGGVCCTCKCQVKEGKVEMDVNYSLDDSELEEGYVLACQSHPRTEKVVLDFDV